MKLKPSKPADIKSQSLMWFFLSSFKMISWLFKFLYHKRLQSTDTLQFFKNMNRSYTMYLSYLTSFPYRCSTIDYQFNVSRWKKTLSIKTNQRFDVCKLFDELKLLQKRWKKNKKLCGLYTNCGISDECFIKMSLLYFHQTANYLSRPSSCNLPQKKKSGIPYS